MSTATAAPAPSDEEVQYGNWRKRTIAGIGRLTAGPVAFIGLELVIVLALATRYGLWATTTGFLIILASVWLVWHRDRHDMTTADHIQEKTMFWFHKALRRHTYRSGLTGETPSGRLNLPGALTTAELSETTDAYDRPFGVVHLPASKHYAVTLRCNPDGGGLHSQDNRNQFVADWGGFGAQFCRETGIAQFSVTNETAPDWGGRTMRYTESLIDPRAAAFAQTAVRQSAARPMHGASASSTFVTITFRPSMLNDQDKDAERRHAVAEIARRLPAIIYRLASTGAGVAVPMPASEIIENVKSAYDPAVAQLIEEAKLDGEPAVIEWADAGPAAAELSWNKYRHDSGTSIVWQMTRAPRGPVTARTINRLLEPHAAIDRKRVTIIYRPIDEGDAIERVEFDNRQAEIGYNNGKGSAAQIADYKKTVKTRDEVEHGAGLVEFSILVTATVTDPDRIEDARVAVEHTLTPATRVTFREVYGGMDTAFAMGLILGLPVSRKNRK